MDIREKPALKNTVRKTYSVCPVCLKKLPAEIVKAGDDYYLEKKCPEHGAFSAVVWRGISLAFEDWGGGEPLFPGCSADCRTCEDHPQKTCCALVEVTDRCDLGCPVCFAESGGSGSREMAVSELFEGFRSLVDHGNTFVQLSGGEPTARDDLPEVVAAAKRAGCENIQLNSNGLRLGAEPEFTQALQRAGLSFVFMQFDGTEDAIYEKLRGAPLLAAKRAAIEVCGELGLGVTLVPTVVPGVNDRNIGEIIKFGLSNSPNVRGVHFQPVSYFGRYPHAPVNSDRITLPEILRAIEGQTAGKIKVSDFVPSSCDHPRCGFHGDFVVLPNGGVMKLTKKQPASCCCGRDDNAHLKSRDFVSRRWKRDGKDGGDESGADYRDMDTFLKRIKSHGFTITCMAFQDAYNLDLERLAHCSLHVYENGKNIPFCARYITPAGTA